MRAIRVSDDAERSLVWDQAPRPLCGPEDVLIRVHATALNRADLLQRAGRYPVPAGASPILGLEAAGVVAEVGVAVSGWQVGDRVCALLSGGGYAQWVASPADLLLPIPDSMTFVEAAALPEVLYTAYLNLILEAELGEDETVLIHAGGSGVGTAALQILRGLGVPTFATASAGKLDGIRELGARAIDRQKEDFASIIKEETDGRGVDVILDPVGGEYLESNLKALAPGGRLVVIGLLGGPKAELNLQRLLMKRQRIVGSVLRSRSVAEKIAITQRLVSDVWRWVEDGQIQPVIDQVYSVEDAGEAQARMRANLNFGKIILRVP